MAPKALITGITGQDGAYLAKFLLDKGYDVVGSYRRNALFNVWRLEALGIAERVRLVEMELLEFSNIMRVIRDVRPTEIYNLAAQSFVVSSFVHPVYTSEVNALGVTRLLDAIVTTDPSIRFYQASTSEMFGQVKEAPQTETTPFHPRSPYGVAKLYAHAMTVNFRESHGLHASSGILFNHESPLRSREFVTRKITSGLARIKSGRQEVLELGNLDAQRDWGFAGDYVRGMWLMLQQAQADDYVLATGVSHSVRACATLAASYCGFDLEWRAEGQGEHATDKKTGKTIIRTNPEHTRLAEVNTLLGNPAKALRALGWKSETTFERLIEAMVKADVDRANRSVLD